jgi:hypothetical protein
LMMEDAWPTPENQRYSSEPWAGVSGSSPIQNPNNRVYMTSANVGGQNFQLVLDTGSSDTWLVTEPFQCLNNKLEKVERSVCSFNKPYERTATFIQHQEYKLRTTYADGEKLSGVIGMETVSVGGVTATNQTIGLVHEANWYGDGQSSGLLGMAFPTLTRAVSGPIEHGVTHTYDPVFFSMYKRGLVNPIFAVALNRADEGPGALSLGGLPGADIQFDWDFARAPMDKLQFTGFTGGKADYTMYVVKADGFNINGRQINTPASFVVDTGTTLSFIPRPIMEAIAAAWVPPLQKSDPVTGDYSVPCRGKAPKFAITIGGKQIWIDGKDLVLEPENRWQKKCQLGVQASHNLVGAGLGMFGGTFMKNMVAVFDVGAAEMRFANRIR